MLPGGDEQPAAARFTIAPLEVKVLRASLRPVRRLDLAPYRSAGRDPGHRPEWHPEARILIEDVRPEIDGGHYPIKRVVGEEVAVSADLFRDGHDQIAAVVQYSFEDEAWQEAPFELVDNDRWRAGFVPDRVGRWHYTIEAWTDRFASWCDDLGKRREADRK